MLKTSTKRKYKTKHDWVKKVVHKELRKKLKFDHTIKWYVHKPESAPENKTHKIFWNLNIKRIP